jgi:hypothetical protein
MPMPMSMAAVAEPMQGDESDTQGDPNPVALKPFHSVSLRVLGASHGTRPTGSLCRNHQVRLSRLPRSQE